MSEPIARPRLLIVEPNESVRRVLGRVLSRRFEITPLAGGLRALARLKEQRFDVLLLDLAVEDVSAIELFHRIREIDPRLPVILTTTTPDDANAMNGTNEIDALACVAKPYHLPALDRALEQALRRR